jgi:putative FmdB family regulatory protein
VSARGTEATDRPRRVAVARHPGYLQEFVFGAGVPQLHPHTGMPTYEYRCTSCGHEFEKFQRMSDEPRAECPECSAEAQRRLSGGAGFLFKGSGFYITDYRSDSYKSAAKAESGESDSKSAGPSTSSGSDASSSTSTTSGGPKSGGKSE